MWTSHGDCCWQMAGKLVGLADNIDVSDTRTLFQGHDASMIGGSFLQLLPGVHDAATVKSIKVTNIKDYQIKH